MGYNFASSEGIDNPRGHDILLACIIAPAIGGTIVLSRAYSKIFVVRDVGLDDWIAFVTSIFAIAFCGTLAQATYHGMGLHTSEIEAHPGLGKGNYFWIMVSSVFYVISLAGYKSALVVLYLRFFHMYKRFRWACYFWLAFTNAYLLSNLLTELGGCHPIQKFWDSDVSGHCIVYVACDIAYGACNIISDIAIAILPLPMIWRMKVNGHREKIGLTIVLGSGAIAFAVAMVRFTYATIDLTSADRNWIAGRTFFWSVLEVWTGIICSCTPSLKPLVRLVNNKSRNWPSAGLSSYRRTGESSSHGSKGLSRGSYDYEAAHKLSLPFTNKDKPGFFEMTRGKGSDNSLVNIVTTNSTGKFSGKSMSNVSFTSSPPTSSGRADFVFPSSPLAEISTVRRDSNDLFHGYSIRGGDDRV